VISLVVLPTGVLFAGALLEIVLAGVLSRSAKGWLAFLTTASAFTAVLLMMPRILFGMSRDGLLPRRVASVNTGGTPTTALFLATLAGIALILSGSFEKLVAMASCLFVVVYLSGFCALFVLRVREPNLPRPFKLWGYPWTNLGVLLASVAFLVASVVGDLKDALFTLILVALSYPAYLLFAMTMKMPTRREPPAGASETIMVPPE